MVSPKILLITPLNANEQIIYHQKKGIAIGIEVMMSGILIGERASTDVAPTILCIK